MMKDQELRFFKPTNIRYFPIGITIFFLFSACSDKYVAYKNLYQFKSEDNKPDYANLNYWAAHPLKWDP
ncbi:MAG TPA: hypothetical protein VFU29_05965, partial [Chitinophagaceae bacterium]|nr:hypothetical protein [Chitinophagaceae bacterium]